MTVLAAMCDDAKGFLWPHDFWVIVTVAASIAFCLTLGSFVARGSRS